MLTLSCRALKRQKAYESLADIRPTIRNKPTGLINTWYDVAISSSPHTPPMRRHPHNQLVQRSTSQSYVDEGTQPLSFAPPQPQFIPMQIDKPSFSQQQQLSMDFPAIFSPMQDPSLSAPVMNSANSFSISPISYSSMQWEGTVGEIQPVRSPPTHPHHFPNTLPIDRFVATSAG